MIAMITFLIGLIFGIILYIWIDNYAKKSADLVWGETETETDEPSFGCLGFYLSGTGGCDTQCQDCKVMQKETY